ncbi:MAG: metallophosphoesterase [Oscillospiraceae bacterium]|nr:metallophosphoesterase [Oscillospiraceae bacterium]
MNILVVSDSHGQTSGLEALARDDSPVRTLRPDYIFHLGDHIRDALVLSAVAPVVAVRGNCDPFFGDAPGELLLDLEGVRLLLTHGHTHRVKASLTPLCARAREAGAAAALFGHTHRAHLSESGGITLFNPGSVSEPRGGPPSYGILRITGGAAAFEHVSLKG